ncbi:hypothetical protein M2480_003010 [Parabacteroides sp. PFB2-12]|uniref:hypothetical protein n=1 Tax=unclassified Parabacteroides TaxID=2649774 RepID=UPI002476E086|nr:MULTISPECIES: hypothetical protein [unclassified Parabacteroides]MDH6343402.1 hypothetical protein [Parabacteroides sp. PM6-13]MDH6392006.1 hypothetical protein [Parabacteroides sp. PFB2-12]
MSKVYTYLSSLPDEQKKWFVPVFGTIERFYTVVYLIIRNEHATEQDRLDYFEERLQVIREVKNRVEKLVNTYGLDGKEVVADIAGDYFEDFVNYKELETDLTNEEFINMIQRISKLT